MAARELEKYIKCYRFAGHYGGGMKTEQGHITWYYVLP
jgi:hypothetical protein